MNLVIDAYDQKPKYLESLDGKKIGEVIQLNAISNTYRERQRPNEVKVNKKDKTSSVVEDALKSYQSKYKLEDK